MPLRENEKKSYLTFGCQIYQGKRINFNNSCGFANLFIEKLNFVILEKLICANSAESD
jgi:hypothetical protein